MFSFAEAEQKANIINNSIVPFGMKLEKAMSQTSSQFHLSFPKLTMTQKYEYISLYLSILYPIRKWSYYANSELSHSLDSDNTSVLTKICGYYEKLENKQCSLGEAATFSCPIQDSKSFHR